MQIYLVVIDSTTSPRNVNISTSDGPNVRNFSLAKGIQNFYFIMAPNSDSAKNMVINTFRARPAVMQDVQRCIQATPLKAITKLLTERQNTWSYIPIGGVRAPGQQGVNNTLQQIEKLNRMGQEHEVSHKDWQPPRPVTYDNQVVDEKDLRGIHANPEDMAVLNGGGRSPNPATPAAGANMQEMQAMMAQMAAMMEAMKNGGEAPPLNTVPTEPVSPAPDLTKHNPSADPELLARIQANMTQSLEVVPDDDIQDVGEAEDWVDDDLKKPID